jgi:murein DD-endopeptidase MepM/ murein hydrolase activator NlpD
MKEQQNKQNKLNTFGMFSSKALISIFKGILKAVKGLFGIVFLLFKGFFYILKNIIIIPCNALKKAVVYAGKIRNDVEKSRQLGRKSYFAALFKGTARYFFGENGFVKRFSGIIIPVLSVMFLVGIISYGSKLQYAMVVECNGVTVGTVENEQIFNEGLKIAKARITYGDDSQNLQIPTSYHLRAMSDSDNFLSSPELADKILSVSENDVIECCGIYVDGEFVGAVDTEEQNTISTALADKLSEYKIVGVQAQDIQYSNDITFENGLYLTSSLYTVDAMEEQLFSKEKESQMYLAEDGDTMSLICAKYDMTEDEFSELNPGISSSNRLASGTVVYVYQTTSFLPVQYTRTIDQTTYINYSVEQISTPTLAAGETTVLVKGERGEKESKLKVTYVDGVETYREIVSTVVSKEPVTEEIGIGTYSAYPEDSSIVLNGTGQFMWPVNGGYISDTFMNSRVHKGIDIAANEGTEIYAADAGTVIASGWNNGGYGYMVMIDHGNGYYTLYAHCSSLTVRTGENVLKGQLIARVGSTGDSTGNHCHFEIRYNGICYNPINFLNNEQ